MKIFKYIAILAALLITPVISAQQVQDSVVCSACVPVVDTVPDSTLVKVDTVRRVASIDTAWTLFTRSDTTWRDSTIWVPLPPVAGNEPAGFRVWTANQADVLPVVGGAWSTAVAGVWHMNAAPASQVGMLQDTSAPCSPPNVWRATYTKGWDAGTGPITLSTQDKATPSELQQVYIKVCVKIGDNGTYENQATGTKMAFISVADVPSGAQCSLIPYINGKGSVSISSSWNPSVKFECAGVLPNFNYIVNQPGGNGTIKSGIWQIYEIFVDVGSIDQSNGVIKEWIDGKLVLSYNNVKLRTAVSGNTHKFYKWRWAPTWGGTAGEKTRSDNFLTDDVYISGTP